MVLECLCEIDSIFSDLNSYCQILQEILRFVEGVGAESLQELVGYIGGFVGKFKGEIDDFGKTLVWKVFLVLIGRGITEEKLSQFLSILSAEKSLD